jgi:uncharacterized membrane protein
MGTSPAEVTTQEAYFILVGMTSTGAMTLIHQWESLPSQSSLETALSPHKNKYVRLMLCRDILFMDGAWKEEKYNPYSLY